MKIERQILNISLLALGTIAAFIWVSYNNHKRYVVTQEWVNHTNSVIRELDNLRSSATEIESHTRGFVISDSAVFINNIASTEEAIEQTVHRLVSLTRDNNSQNRRMLLLQDLLSHKISLQKQIIFMHRTKTGDADKVISSLQGKVLMDSINGVIDTAREEENSLLHLRIEENKNAVGSRFSTIIISVSAIFFLLILILVILNRDIILRKRTEQIAKASEVRLRILMNDIKDSQRKLDSILRSTQDGFYLLDVNHDLVLINEAGRNILMKVFGQSVEIGENLFRFVAPERKKIIDRVVASVSRGAVETVESKINTETGEVWYESIYFPVTGDEGSVSGICISTRDITERVQYQKQLLTAKKAAESAERMQETFLANMSHEIRTPMNGIVGMTDILITTPLSDQQQEFVKIIRHSSDTLLFLINDILDLSKIKAGKLAIEKSEMDLDEVLNSAVAPFIIKCRVKEIDFVFRERPSLPSQLIADQFRLIQILNNILSNAVKFTSKGRVELSVSVMAETKNDVVLRFAVKDTGIGIDEDLLENIFGSFEQGADDTARKYGGTGLGLAITRNLIELQGGELGVTSVLGEGTTFAFILRFDKVKNNRLKAAGSSMARNIDHCITGKKILVVEDNEINQKVISYNLEKAGIVVRVADNGKKALEIFASGEDFDLIIMDLQMPEMNGFETAVHIRTELKLKTPIIAMTASVMRNERIKCMEAGMNDYIPKPFDQSELFNKIRRLVNGVVGEEVTEETKGAPAHTLYDLGFLNEMEDPEYTKEVLQLFLNTVPAVVDRIREGVLLCDAQQVCQAAHRLKTSLGLLQMKELLGHCTEMETVSKNVDYLEDGPLEKITDLLKKFNTQMNIVMPLISGELKRIQSVEA